MKYRDHRQSYRTERQIYRRSEPVRYVGKAQAEIHRPGYSGQGQ